MNLKEILEKRQNSEKISENSIKDLIEIIGKRDSRDQQLAAIIVLKLIDVKTTPSIVTSFIETLIKSQLNEEFIVKSLAKIVLKFNSVLISKTIQTFLARNSIQNRFSSILFSFHAISTQLRHNYIKQLIQFINNSLKNLCDVTKQQILDIRFRCQTIAILITISGQFSLPVESILLLVLDLMSKEETIVLTPLLRESSFFLLEALLVTLGNDCLLYCQLINKTIIDSIELQLETIDLFLIKYLSFSSSFRFNSQQLQQLIPIIRSRIQSNPSINAFKCLKAIVSAHYPLIESSNWSEINQEITKLLLQYYRSREPEIYENWILRIELWKVYVCLNNTSLLNFGISRDDNHVIREFCSKSLRKKNQRIDWNIEQNIDETIEQNIEPIIEETIDQNIEPIIDDRMEITILEEEPEIEIIEPEVNSILKDFVFD